MSDNVDLYCTFDEDDQQWIVWFPHPLGGKNVLESFDNEADARGFWQEQINSTGYIRQTSESNTARSKSYQMTASKIKKDGHNAEQIFADRFGGSVVRGREKTDTITELFGRSTCKAGGKIQMLLQITDNVGEYWGYDHPLYLASRAQREYYEDRHFNNEQNSKSLYINAKQQVAGLVKWLNDKENFRRMLAYSLFKNVEIDTFVDMYRTNGKIAYITPRDRFIEIILNSNPIAEQTESGLRVSIGIDTASKDKFGNFIRRKAFMLEVRSDIKHCKSLLYRMEAKHVFPLIRKDESCIKVSLQDENS